MINPSPTAIPTTSECSWQELLSNAISDPKTLMHMLEIDWKPSSEVQQACNTFALKVPLPYLDKMEKGNLQDPLLRQILPLSEEMNQVPGYNNDPLAEQSSNPCEGLIHKYKGRVLLILTGACAVNCRYCFRRHFPYQENRLGPAQWHNILDYLSSDSSIHEVIFSGGDPLATSDKRLHKMISDLEAIPHLKRLRIHSRLPIVIPQRITTDLCNILQQSRFDKALVLHSNHANEIDQQLARGIQQLKKADVTVLNQAVLLRGVNDSVAAQKSLSETLFSAGILPYYLFTLDPVAGAAHFNVPDNEALSLFANLQAELPGYLLPRLAREIPGKPSKTLLTESL